MPPTNAMSKLRIATRYSLTHINGQSIPASLALGVLAAILLGGCSSVAGNGHSANRVAALHAGAQFRDCDECPEMVVVPPGSFIMGSTQEERHTLDIPERFDRMESPRHPVRISKAFAVGRFAVTFADWDACLAAGGCDGYRPDDMGWGRDRRPVINVNWADAQSYVTWLGHRSGHAYRLLSEAEWEFAARAGTTGYYYYGPVADDSKANFGSHNDRTREVGSYPPNPFGLYDMSGNTAQWVADCYHESYEGAPSDGTPWLTGDCITRNVRGGGWSLSGRSVRSAQRIGDPPESRNSHLGFRVARSLGD